jgi:tetratricopeptide (TPR) repeat protein
MDDRTETAKALFFKGLENLQQEHFEQAEEDFRACLSLMPDRPSALTNLAVVLLRRGKIEESAGLSRRVLARDEQSAQAWLNLGIAEKKLRHPVQAISCFERTLTLEPQNVDAGMYLGEVLHSLGRNVEALACYEKALVVDAKHAGLWCDRAVALQALKRLPEAQASCERALQIAPDMAGAWGNLGNVLHELKRFEEALHAYDRAEQLAGESAQIWSCRGNTLYSLGRLKESVQACERALALDQQLAAAWSNLGNALVASCRHAEAALAYEHATGLDPAYATARWNLSITQLALGNFAQGWANYAARWLRSDADTPRHTDMPRLERIEAAVGRSVLVWCEQGMGDSLQFCRYIPLLAERGVKVYFEVPATLFPLMQSLPGCELLRAEQDRAQGDFQCPLLSLPGLFATYADSIPCVVPYLHVAQERVHHWREKLALRPSVLNIGVACAGNPRLKNDANRSMPLAALAPLLACGQVFLIQKELREADPVFLRQHPELVFLGPQIGDFADSAAIVQNMDVIVSVDTSLAHLAGSLARPLHVLLPWAPEWRWQLRRSDSPWYPQAVLHRQASAGDWAGVVESVRLALQAANAAA